MSGLFRPLFLLVSLLSLALAPGFAATVPGPGAPNVAACADAPAAEFLNARLTFWQQRLNLQEWKLSVLASHPAELKPQTLGNIRWDTGRKSAVVRVLSPSDYNMTCSAALDDMEMTVVHELVHLTLSPLRSATTNRTDEEQTVNRIADALLKLERASRRQSAPALAAKAPTYKAGF
jgi:hypothetical protein